MTKVFSKFLRISLIVILAVIIPFAVLSLLLGVTKAVMLFFTTGTSFDSLSSISIIGFIPICAICVLIATVVYIQVMSTRRIEKLILKADNMPNNYSFEAPEYKKPRLRLFVKIVSILALCIMITVCALMICFFISCFFIRFGALIYNIIAFTNWLGFVINLIDMLIALTYYMIFSAIAFASVLGAISILIGGRSSQVDELALVLNQKSQFAKIRKMEENDEVDEISQLF